MELEQLREQVARWITESRSYLSEITDETTDERAAEINEMVDRILADVAKAEARIAQIERLNAAEQRMTDAAEREERQRREGRRPDGSPVTVPGAESGDAPSYREAMHAYLRAAGNLGAMAPEARAVLQAGFQRVEQRAQVTTTDAAGGFTVPEEMQEILIRSMRMWGPMYDENIATVITTTGGNPLPMPTVDDTSETAEASTEGATLTDDGGKDVTFGQKVLESFSFDTKWIRVSLELAQDSIFAMEQLLGDLLGERLGRIANQQLTVGTGSNAPQGILTGSALGITAASATAIGMDEIIDLEHSVDPAYRQSPRCGWMFNDTTLQVIRKLKDGDGNYLWQMGDVQRGVPDRFHGRPYYLNQAMPSIATGNRTMLFGDFSKYYVRRVGAPLIGAIQDKDFWPGFGVAGYIRFDGEMGDSGAIKHLVQA